MKQHGKIGSLVLAIALLFAIFLQSADGVYHIEKKISQDKCLHQLGQNKAELTHAHHGDEHCFVCEFTFSPIAQAPGFYFSFQKVETVSSYTFPYSKEITQYFKGSLFALRAPPVFVV